MGHEKVGRLHGAVSLFNTKRPMPIFDSLDYYGLEEVGLVGDSIIYKAIEEITSKRAKGQNST
eukprot:scaffold1398_cov116-Cylindrotheca_fusiformis.AAC.10